MKIRAGIWAIAFAIGCLVAPAPAQMMRGPDIRGVWSPVVGAGGVYQVDRGGEKSDMTIAIVGKESVDGKDEYWLEFSFASPRSGGEMVMKQLIVLDGSNTRIERRIIQPPGMDPMELPSTMLQRQGHATHPADLRNDADKIGTETVTTPAGTFTCDHYRAKDSSGDFWIASKVPPYGLVKMTSKDVTMILTSVLTEAKDKITGTPKPFDPAQMMRQPN